MTSSGIPTPPILTVSQLTAQVKQTVETRFPRVWVQGELSNVKRHSSGHLYFTLKDEGAQLNAAMWRSRVGGLAFAPADGMKVIVRGPITVYAPRGNYQIEVEQMQPLGIGELQMAFERMKQRLSAEGLFEASRKKRLPPYPERIGIVTSPTGAALQDMRSVLERRMPNVEVILSPVRVQGAGAAEEIAQAIREMNRYGEVDVLIVGRGGGSLEDLWPFNEEIVARAIATSTIPVVSAVGHEVDFSIADFVADLRAPTPSAAAELVVRDRSELLETLRNISYTIHDLVLDRVRSLRQRITALVTSYAFNTPRGSVRESVQHLDELNRALVGGYTRIAESSTQRHAALAGRLEALSPRSILKRGYAIIRSEERVVTRARSLKPGDEASIEFADGSVKTRVEPEKRR